MMLQCDRRGEIGPCSYCGHTRNTQPSLEEKKGEEEQEREWEMKSSNRCVLDRICGGGEWRWGWGWVSGGR